MILNNLKSKLKEHFFQNPTQKLRVRQIERVVNVPLPSVIRYTKELEKEEILKRSKIADIVIYSANRNSGAFLLEKRLFNLKQLYDSGLIDRLKNTFSNPAIILFGSYSKGEDMEESDIDLYIETPARTKLDLAKFEKILQRKIHLFGYKKIQEIENKELANNILNGIVLNGYIEVF